ncbi:hypothetical protein ACXR2U_09130 [Jatrophihabitans sp. YIM 134969]
MSDEIAQGRDPARPPSYARYRRSLVAGGAALAVLVAVGVISGGRDRHPGGPAPTASTSAPTRLTSTTARCASLDGRVLTVGVGVHDGGPASLTVRQVVPSFPLGGFEPATRTEPDRGACPGATAPATLRSGEDATLLVVLTVLDPHCIGPLVVDVGFDYVVAGGAPAVLSVAAFPDLGGFDLPSDCGSPPS